jgi:hypothetical protein
LTSFPENLVNNNKNGGLFFKDYMSKVVDVTIAYPNCQPLNLWNIVSASRPACVTHVHYRIFDIKEVKNLNSFMSVQCVSLFR